MQIWYKNDANLKKLTYQSNNIRYPGVIRTTNLIDADWRWLLGIKFLGFFPNNSQIITGLFLVHLNMLIETEAQIRQYHAINVADNANMYSSKISFSKLS